MEASDLQRMRALVLGSGLAVLTLTAVVLWVLAVDTEEVIAVTLFLPVFAAAALGGIRWGLAVGVLAGLGYLGLRLDELQVLASAQQWFRPIAYGIAYVSFGGLAGWAATELTRGIEKLDRFDVTDDDSELLNARGLHRQLDQEVARAKRYGSDFAVVTVVFEVDGDRDERRRARHQVGDIVRACVRSVDDTGRITVNGREQVVAVLPETPRSGAEVVGQKIVDNLRASDETRDAEVRWLTHPEDETEIDELLLTLHAVVVREHPEAMHSSS